MRFEVGDTLRHKTDPAEHRYEVMDRRATYYVLEALVTRRTLLKGRFDCHCYYELALAPGSRRKLGRRLEL